MTGGADLELLGSRAAKREAALLGAGKTKTNKEGIQGTEADFSHLPLKPVCSLWLVRKFIFSSLFFINIFSSYNSHFANRIIFRGRVGFVQTVLFTLKLSTTCIVLLMTFLLLLPNLLLDPNISMNINWLRSACTQLLPLISTPRASYAYYLGNF